MSDDCATRAAAMIGRGALVVIAHPDDEVFCSGLIARLTASDTPVDLVCVTWGEGGLRTLPPRDWRRLVRHLIPPRVRELRRAGRALGVRSVRFLGLEDPPSRDGRLFAPRGNLEAARLRLARLVRVIRPEAVIGHGSTGEYGHPGHVFAHRLATAVCQTARDLPFLSFAADHSPGALSAVLNRGDPATHRLDGLAERSRRLRSLSCHRSQRRALAGLLPAATEPGCVFARWIDATRFEGYCAPDGTGGLRVRWDRVGDSNARQLDATNVARNDATAFADNS